MVKKNYDAIDLVKIIACICIVGIHTEAFSDILTDFQYYYLLNGLFRVAVPFFFTVSGFFLGKKFQKSLSKASIQEYLLRLVPPLLFWEIVNVLIEVLKQRYIQKLHIHEISMNVLRSLLFYPYGALWYVQALLFASIIVFYFKKKDKMTICMTVSTLLYVIGLLANTYFFIIKGTAWEGVVRTYLEIFVSSRNVVFVGLFFVSIGVWIADSAEYYFDNRFVWLIFVISLSAFICELVFTKGKPAADDKSMYLSFIILIPSMVTILCSSTLKLKISRLLRRYSTGIYFMHKAMIHVWLIIGKAVHVDLSHTLLFTLTIFSCVMVLSILYRINDHRINTIIM